jgi:hypothetical protein
LSLPLWLASCYWRASRWDSAEGRLPTDACALFPELTLDFMNTSLSQQALADQLATAVAPSLQNNTVVLGRKPKSVAKTLRHLAKQLTKESGKMITAPKAKQPSAKQVRHALAGELMVALQPFMVVPPESKKMPKALIKTVKHLAAQLSKQRVTSPQQVIKPAFDSAPSLENRPTALPVLAASPPKPTPRRAAAPKHAAPSEAVAPLEG